MNMSHLCEDGMPTRPFDLDICSHRAFILRFFEILSHANGPECEEIAIEDFVEQCSHMKA